MVSSQASSIRVAGLGSAELRCLNVSRTFGWTVGWMELSEGRVSDDSPLYCEVIGYLTSLLGKRQRPKEIKAKMCIYG